MLWLGCWSHIHCAKIQELTHFVLSLLGMLWLGSSLLCLSCVCYGLGPVCSVSHVYVMAWIQFVLLLMCMLWLGSSLFCLSCVCYGLDPVCSVSPMYVMAWIQFVLSLLCMLWLGSSLSCLSCVCYCLDPHSRSACILTMGQEVYTQEKQAHPGCTLPEPPSALPRKNNTLVFAPTLIAAPSCALAGHTRLCWSWLLPQGWPTRRPSCWPSMTPALFTRPAKSGWRSSGQSHRVWRV